jgi:hypothetical protein
MRIMLDNRDVIWGYRAVLAPERRELYSDKVAEELSTSGSRIQVE